MNIPKNLSELSNETNETPVNMLRFKQHWVLLITLLLVVSYVQYGMNVNFEWRVFLSSSLFLAVFAVLLVPFLTHQQAQMERSYMDWTASDIDSEEPCTNQTSNNNLTVFEAVQTFQMWALCFIFCVLSGAGLMVIYNVNAVANAAGERPSPFFVSLISLANGVGRLVAGICSDFVLRNTICSRLHLLGLVAALMSVAHIVLSTGHHAVLLPAFLAVGFLFGCTVSLVAVIVADLFGSKYIATNFGFVDTSPIVGSFIFATLVVNGSYEYNTVDEQGVQSCVGVGCFQMAFAVNATVCAAAAMLSMFLNARMQTA